MSKDHTLQDSFGRHINYLRISLTDRCNFRCLYCMPPEGLSVVPKENHLTRAEITRFVKIASRHGVNRVRLTGGEPLLRKDVIEIVRDLADLPQIKTLALTTNGHYLNELASDLKKAGLQRLNISLDSLDAKNFKRITLRSTLQTVIEGIFAVKKIGLPIKLNCVVMKGINDHEVLDFVRFGLEHDIEIRFIEFMPLCGTGWKPELVYPLDRAKAQIMDAYKIIPMLREVGAVTRDYQVISKTNHIKLGFITTMTDPFCSDCSRLRLSADGQIRPCLFSEQAYDVRELLRSNNEAQIEAALKLAIREKPAGNEFAEKPYQEHTGQTPSIRSIGG